MPVDISGFSYARAGLCCLARLLVFFGVIATTCRIAAQQYEVDGTVELLLSHTDRIVWKDFLGNFRVYVNGCAWLIQVTETNEFDIPQRREVGSIDGKEMFEMVVPSEPISPSGVLPAVVTTRRFVPTALLASNAIPVGNLDSSFTGHLWLMFASSCYFRTAAPGQLTPVFDFGASPYMNPSARMKARWVLSNGQVALPSQVTYYGPDGAPSAVYAATGFTNVGTLTLPTGFHFSQPGTGYKEVRAVVTDIRPTCSRADLRPAVKQQTVMVDLRWHPNDLGAQFTTYRANYWPSVKQAQGIYFSTRTGAPVPVRAPSKLMIVILVGLLIAPPVIIVLRKLRTR
jgi:hypothetical protein